MSTDPTRKLRNLYIAAAVILFGGLGVSLSIYLNAKQPAEDIMIFEYENSKMYARSLKIYGGQMAVLADDFRRWFVGLWHGRTLAGTVAGIAVFVAAALFLEARHLRSVQNTANRREEGPGCRRGKS